MDSMVDQGADHNPEDSEEFCSDCFAGMESSEHHEKCVVQRSARVKCASAYNASRGLWLHCTGEHLRGNIFRGDVHQQRYAGIVWTWYDDEAHVTRGGDV